MPYRYATAISFMAPAALPSTRKTATRNAPLKMRWWSGWIALSLRMSAFNVALGRDDATQEPDIPGHGGLQPAQDVVGRLVAQQLARLAYVGLRMAHVARAEIGIYRRFVVAHALAAQRLGQELVQLVERGAAAVRHVVDLVHALFRGQRAQQVRLYRVFNKAEIAAGFAVPIDDHVVAAEHGGRPFGNHRPVGAFRDLGLAEHLQVA